MREEVLQHEENNFLIIIHIYNKKIKQSFTFFNSLKLQNFSFSFEGSGDDVLLAQSCVQPNISTIWGVREQRYGLETLPPLLKEDSEATIETCIESTSLTMLARYWNQSEFSYHQLKTSKST
ncbi:hypothetical protein AAZX31_11G204900 [Glycine max]